MRDVRSQGQSGKHILAVSFSGFDPKRLSSVKLFCSAGFFLFDHLVVEREHGDGSSRPSALAALRLITSSNLAGCTTGRSAGFSRLRMRPT
jgi:hypothetical protein